MSADKPLGPFCKFFHGIFIRPLVEIPEAGVGSLTLKNPIPKITKATREAAKDTLLLPFRVVGQIASGTARSIWSLLKGIVTKTPFIPFPTKR